MTPLRLSATALLAILAGFATASAQPADGGTQADAERAMRDYLAIWARPDGISAASIARFYAPRVIYYGKVMSRAQLLAEKRSYAREWPERRYDEVPGSFTGRCNADRSQCQIAADMTWRRVSRADRVSTGRAHIVLTFVPTEGSRKIARESARIY